MGTCHSIGATQRVMGTKHGNVGGGKFQLSLSIKMNSPFYNNEIGWVSLLDVNGTKMKPLFQIGGSV